jgi:FMN phosphatase YigB (HAD superfamily)
MISAVIFDWGGVIQRTASHASRHALDAELGLAPGSVEKAVFDSPIWQEASVGRCSAELAWHTIVTSVGWPAERVDEFVDRFFAGDHVDQVLVEHIRFWRERGLKVGLLSNAPPGRSSGASASGRWGMDGLFNAQVFSYQVGVLKPDPRMYRAILAALDVPAEQSLFIDDASANVLGALRAGMGAVRFVGVDVLLQHLACLGLPLPVE